MKLLWKILAGIAVVAVAFGAWAEADFREWDLKMHVPTASVKDSQAYRVFDRRLSVSPAEFELAGKSYRIKEAWLEHRTEPRRASIFFTRQEIFPELVLCVDLGAQNTQADVLIKGAKHDLTYYSGTGGVRMTEVGQVPPKGFAFCTHDGRHEVQFLLKEAPNTERTSAP